MDIEVILYTRKNCPLCDKAKSSIRAAASLHRLPIALREVDIDDDAELQARYTDDVPVIHVDGVEAFRHQVTPEEFAAYVHTSELAALARGLGNGWRVVDGHHLEREYAFPDFAEALAFTNRVGALAGEQGHHPDIYLAWGKLRITIWTHKIDGLSRSDFVLAAKIDRL